MDDEEMIREVGSEMLRVLGYQGTFTRDGEETLSVFKQAIADGIPFQAVILDLTTVNGVGGVETLRGLLEIDHRVRAIVCSGYSNDPVLANYREYGFLGVLPKPFSLQDLDTQLRRVLMGSPVESG